MDRRFTYMGVRVSWHGPVHEGTFTLCYFGKHVKTYDSPRVSSYQAHWRLLFPSGEWITLNCGGDYTKITERQVKEEIRKGLGRYRDTLKVGGRRGRTGK